MNRIMRTKDSTTTMKFIWLAVFAVAMGFLEAIVVVYLRQIYYPEGFDFPLKMMSPEIITVEWIREFATLVMLAVVGIIAGKNNLQKLLYFLYSFAVWDIFYYVALKLLLGWPASLLTWDILFLIPITWLGPVLAPVISSLTMILMAVTLIPLQEKGYTVIVNKYEWGLIYLGAFIIFCTFIWDFTGMIFRGGLLSEWGNPAIRESFMQVMTSFTPSHYNWALFVLGEMLILLALGMILKRTLKR